MSYRNERKFALKSITYIYRVHIGDNCFCPDTEDRDEGHFDISNCKLIQKLKIGNNSFFNYTEFTISDLPELVEVDIGSDCFKYITSIMLCGKVYTIIFI